MTRIIAGTAGGRRLATPPGSGTRPTSDRVREAVFSALASRGILPGARVLDLYAGSGALGLEAVSRGAAALTLVESDRRAVAVLRRNVATLGLPGVRVQAGTVEKAVGRPREAGSAPYDLVLLDPPYDVTEEALRAVLHGLVAGRWLAGGALVVVERSSRSPEPPWPAGLQPDAAKRYGETAVWYAVAAAEPTSPGKVDPRDDV